MQRIGFLGLFFCLACVCAMQSGCGGAVILPRGALQSTGAPVTLQAPLKSPEDALFAMLPKGDAAQAALCAAPFGHDAVTSNLCASPAPVIGSMQDLQRALGLTLSSSSSSSSADANVAYALTGHSSSLTAHSVSAINPRAIVCRRFGSIPNAAEQQLPNSDYFACLGYTRGENFAEVITTDAVDGSLNFYIIKFEMACSVTHTCTPGDVLSPLADSNWVSVAAYEDDPYFKDTILDCRQCHQPNAWQPPMLRLQETTAPFTHFFSTTNEGGKALLADYHTAHGDNEDYGPIPATMIDRADGGMLAAFVMQENFTLQPNPFNSAAIAAEVTAANPAQPYDNRVPGVSPTWLQTFSVFQRGLAIAPPYHDVKVTDANKLIAMSADYRRMISGEIPPQALPDIRQIFPDDPNLTAQMGFAAVPGQDGAAIIVNVCTQCHNDQLDATLSRARFSVPKLMAGQLSDAEKAAVRARIQLDDSSLARMPPARFRSLQPNEIQAIVDYLQ